MGKLINRIPGPRLLISSLPGSALRMLVDIARQASRCQHAFSKPCLVDLISKDTHPVFSIYQVTVRCHLLFIKTKIPIAERSWKDSLSKELYNILAK